MKIAVTGDWHFHPFKAHSTTMPDGTNSRLHDIELTWDMAVDEARNEGCEIFLVAGDVFNVRGAIKPSVLNIVFRCFEHAASFFPVVVIPGNHDMEDFRGGPTAIDMFEAINNVYVMGAPSTMALRNITIAGIPYQNSVHEFYEAANSIEFLNEADIVLCHQGVDDLAPAGVPAHGFTVARIREICGDRIPVFCGHYHKPGLKDNVFQVGAPLQHNFGDEGQERGMWIADFKDGTLRSAALRPLYEAPVFKTVSDKDELVKMEGFKHFLRIKTDDPKKAAAIAIEAKAESVVTVLEREYASHHGKDVKVGTTADMLAQYFDITGEEKGRECLKLFDEVCR